MKATLLTIALALSLAANAAFYFRLTVSNPSPAASIAGATGRTNAPSSVPIGKSTTLAPAPTAEEAAQLIRTWQELRSGDLKTLIQRLRAAGFPEAMIRTIVSAQVSEQFAARRQTLLSEQEDTPYWKTQQRLPFDPKTMSALRELTREQREQVKALLGPDGAAGNEEKKAYQRRQFGDLPPEKLDQLQNIVGDYAELRQQVYANANGVILPEDREKLALLEKEQRADLAGILTPQEIENYELRSSQTANLLRSQLGIFKPSEEEFRLIFHATRAAEEQYGALSGGGNNGNQIRQVQAAMLEQTKSLLTPERYADLKQATDPAYLMINRLVARLELPPTAAVQVVAVQQDITKRALALRTDHNLSPEQRTSQLSGLLQEATTSLTTSLGGPRGLEAYKQYGGQWLQTLQPRPAPPKG